MSKEEQEAVEKLKDIIKVNNDFLKDIPKITIKQKHIKAIDIVLNLIEKQQKEIENLANGIRVIGTNPKITTEEIIKEFSENQITKDYMKKFEREYISKDKIREKIKKAKEIKWHTPKLVIEYFEELLEE